MEGEGLLVAAGGADVPVRDAEVAGEIATDVLLTDPGRCEYPGAG
jgi:hypothetical protein